MVGLDDRGIDGLREELALGALAQRRPRVAQEAALAGDGLYDALVLQLRVGLGDRVAVQPELLGERANGGERLAGTQRPGCRSGADLLDDLKIRRHAGLEVDLKE